MPSPHTPWVPLPEYKGKSGAGLYGDYVAEVDAMIGRVLDTVHELGMDQNTIVVVTSDNGAGWKTRTSRPIRIAPMRAGAARRPTSGRPGIAFRLSRAGRDTSRANTVCDETASLTDLMGTLAAILHRPLPPDAGEDSFNLLPALERQPHKPIRKDIIEHSNGGMFSIREGNWKLELGLGSGGFTAPAHVDPAPGGAKGNSTIWRWTRARRTTSISIIRRLWRG